MTLLQKKYPEMMQHVRCGISLPDGWYNIVDVLCAEITSYIKRKQREFPNEAWKFPQVEQIKEKFGELRFYVGEATDEIYAMIDLACALSARICETCGSPGQTRQGSWIKTLCEDCYNDSSN